VAGLSFTRTGTPALLPATGAVVAVPLAAIAANPPSAPAVGARLGDPVRRF